MSRSAYPCRASEAATPLTSSTTFRGCVKTAVCPLAGSHYLLLLITLSPVSPRASQLITTSPWINATSPSWTPPWWCPQGTCGSCSSMSRWGAQALSEMNACAKDNVVPPTEPSGLNHLCACLHREGRTFLRRTSSRRRWWWLGGWGTWGSWALSSTGCATARKPTASDAATRANVSTCPLRK